MVNKSRSCFNSSRSFFVISYNILQLAACQACCLDPDSLGAGPPAWELEALFFCFIFFRNFSQLFTYEGGRSSSAIVKYLSSDRLELSLIVLLVRRLKAIIYIVLRHLVPDPSDWTLVQPVMEFFRHWASFSQGPPCIVLESAV